MAQRRQGLNDLIARFGDQYVTNNIIFILFLALLGALYISNSNLAMNRVRKMNHMTEVLKQKRWYYVQGLSDAMQRTKLSRVKKDVADLGLQELLEPPQIIVKQQ